MGIVSFSGIDGSGKGTQIKIIEIFLNAHNRKFKTVWARGSWTPGIELVKRIVRKDKGFNEEQKAGYRKEARSNPKTSKIILILSILDMTWYFGIWYRILKLFYKELICDRYIWDTLVDFKVNFSSFDFEKWFIWKFLVWITPKPDISILLVISAEMSLTRGIEKNEEHMEKIEIKRKKVDEYQKLITLNYWNCMIKADDSSDNISQKIIQELYNHKIL